MQKRVFEISGQLFCYTDTKIIELDLTSVDVILYLFFFVPAAKYISKNVILFRVSVVFIIINYILENFVQVRSNF